MRKTSWAVLLFCLLPLSAAHGWQGEVVKVLDGDTVQVQRDGKLVKIRLYGIDCPERDQPYGDKAGAFARAQFLHRQVQVESVDTDMHGRTVALVSSSGRMLNRELVRAGYAWLYSQYCHKELLCRELSDLEQEARKTRRGLWRGRRPIPPWKWRQGVRR